MGYEKKAEESHYRMWRDADGVGIGRAWPGAGIERRKRVRKGSNALNIQSFPGADRLWTDLNPLCSGKSPGLDWIKGRKTEVLQILVRRKKVNLFFQHRKSLRIVVVNPA